MTSSFKTSVLAESLKSLSSVNVLVPTYSEQSELTGVGGTSGLSSYDQKAAP
jgi:hypothetical protein